MQQMSMICSHANVGIDSSEAISRLRRREALLGREAHARLDEDDVEEAEHRRAAVLDLHDRVAAHVAALDEAQRVPDAQRRRHAKVALCARVEQRVSGRSGTAAAAAG